MFDACLLGEITAWGALTGAYWACLVVGGGLLLLSMLGGDSDSDVDVDTDFDLDTDVDAEFETDGAFDAELDAATDAVGAAHAHADALSLSTWFSMRFVVFFVAVFGALGLVFTYLTPAGTWGTLGVAVVGGLLVGQSVHHTFRAVRRSSGDSTPRPHDYVHKLARVTIAITPPKKGEIAIQVRAARRFIPAVTQGATEFAAGDEVVVVGYRAGVAHVVSREEFERHARST